MSGLSDHIWKEGETYMSRPSTKIDALLQIIKYHLSAPGLQPLKVTDQDANTLEPDPNALRTFQDPSLRPDRIVVYLAFPSNNAIVHKVGQ